jgi:2,4-dienoyl-CoA reductase-like NADH-dependent reductase (Old Yellow Enzyme family)
MQNYKFLESFEFKNGVKVKNRIVMAPMTTMSSFFNGMITSDELDYYANRTEGPGMVITAVAYVSTNGQGFEGQLSVAHDVMIPGLKRLADTIKIQGTKAILQIFHAGRKSDSKVLRGESPVSASAVAAVYPKNAQTPRALAHDELLQIIDDFGKATRRAIQAGFDGIELHGANTYLLQQFFSPHSNRRTDKWGGNQEHRMSFALAVISKVKENIEKYAKEDFIFGYRLSPEEVETPGLRMEDSLYFADRIKDKVDYIHLSLKSYKLTSLNDSSDREIIVTKFKNVLKNDVPIIAVGGIELPSDAEDALNLGADFAAMGKQLLREPKWVQKVLNNDEGNIRTRISAMELEELIVPPGMQTYLTTFYKEVMNYSVAPKLYSNEEEQSIIKRFINH